MDEPNEVKNSEPMQVGQGKKPHYHLFLGTFVAVCLLL
jgi:hypothetical protein